ncbi:nucleotidyltransferase family protein [Pelagibacterium lacus]|nr:nucleotidyltransferase family protein [Pelagibacterium lacus]
MIALEQCATLVLAAGASRRFGADNKLLAEIEGRPMVEHILMRIAALPFAQRLAVVDDLEGPVAGIARRHGITPVLSPDAATGMGASLAAGAKALGSESAAVFVLLGDMPFVPAAIFAALAARLEDPVSIARPRTPQGPGHPVLFARRHFSALAGLEGDSGAGAVIAAHRDHLDWVDTTETGCIADFDTTAALAAWRGSV